MGGTENERAARGRRVPDARRPPPGPRIRRASDRIASGASAVLPSRALPSLEALRAAEGRAVLESLVRRRGASAPALVAALAEGWRRADGEAPNEDDLRALLEVHGLSRSFQRRERDAALHALKAAGGFRARAAAALGLAPDGLDALLARSGAGAEAEAVREARRAELRRRATLAERARLVTADRDHLADLGLLAEMEADLAARLPEHLRALRAAGAAPLGVALGRSLGLAPGAAAELALRLGLRLEGPAPGPRRPSASDRREPAPRAAGGRRGGGRPGPRRAGRHPGSRRPQPL